ncbi:MAG: hypothetical protein GXO79_07410 [Chlorobi bacterium]|nr:hypothetical protein [Chlorobiota bacterium]
MNKKLLIIFLIFSPFFATGQKCFYEKDIVDETSQLLVRRTEPVVLCKINGHPFYFKSQQIGDRKYLKLRYFKYNSFSIIEGSKFIFYFNNGNKLMIDPLEIKKKNPQNKNGFTTISSMLIYQLSEEDFNLLLNNPVVEIGVYSNTGITKKEIKPKNQHEIQNLLKCIQ